MNTHWTDIVAKLNRENKAYVLITVLGIKGSAPRDNGTKMVVSQEQNYNTIGGGNLEYIVTEQARAMLSQASDSQHLEHFPLGPKLKQCCGGSATILFEFFAASRANVMLFGAGHVGSALSKIMSDLPVSLRWVDSRAEQFPESLTNNTLKKLNDNVIEGGHVEAIVADAPPLEIANMPSNSYFMIMTHDHELDFQLCVALLSRDDAHFIGLIGSNTKWLRFRKRLSEAGFSDAKINQIQCPIGLDDVSGKRPMEVAVSIAGQFIQQYQSQRQRPEKTKQKGVSWKKFQTTDLITANCDNCNVCEKD